MILVNCVGRLIPVTFFSLLLLERVFPYKSEWNSSRRDVITFIKYFIFNLIVFELTLKVNEGISLYRFFYLEKYLPHGFLIFIGFIYFELLGYWVHRFSHNVQFFKKFHFIHHTHLKLNLFANFTANSFFIFGFSLIVQAFMCCAGFPSYCFVISIYLMTIINIFNHSNISINFSILNYILITPYTHRIHHNIKLYNKKNFSLSIPLGDFIFGTYCSKEPSEEVLGLKEQQKYPIPSNFIESNFYPFQQ